jgi:hypothetical protein
VIAEIARREAAVQRAFVVEQGPERTRGYVRTSRSEERTINGRIAAGRVCEALR